MLCFVQSTRQFVPSVEQFVQSARLYVQYGFVLLYLWKKTKQVLKKAVSWNFLSGQIFFLPTRRVPRVQFSAALHVATDNVSTPPPLIATPALTLPPFHPPSPLTDHIPAILITADANTDSSPPKLIIPQDQPQLSSYVDPRICRLYEHIQIWNNADCSWTL